MAAMPRKSNNRDSHIILHSFEELRYILTYAPCYLYVEGIADPIPDHQWVW